MYSIDKSRWIDIAKKEELKKQISKEMFELVKQLRLDFKEYKKVTGVNDLARFYMDNFEYETMYCVYEFKISKFKVKTSHYANFKILMVDYEDSDIKHFETINFLDC